ncbi:histidine kinase [Sediminibacterium sp.]|uniref:sensor histidine kinase n=1 Tax=Sediminibacterium sp. TaxID=1917865 RepID=UPI0025F81E68|nr:histidine kinase [Sediminibacterium sp.]MBW0177956.1 histidine kinase [Sediminibacterium sp.]
MQFIRQKWDIARIQWVIWVLLFGINVLNLLHFDTLLQSMGYSVIIISSYMAIVYGNAALLIPRLYMRQQKLLYVLLVLILLIAVALYRSGTSWWFYNTYYAPKPQDFPWTSVFGALVSSVLIYFTSVLFYIALRYFHLQKQQQVLEKKQVESELNLLKAQVQPHFLFNSLNNIYFYAQRESPVTAAMLEKLSQIMRYFVDEAPKDIISLQTELSFIHNYIELEKTRMRYPLSVSVQETGNTTDVQIPPMLIIPLVENVFKHGIDKRREDNFIDISIENAEQKLTVTVKNRIAETGPKEESGKGLDNLRNRMQLLYGDKSSLKAEPDDVLTYTAILSIPL